MGRLKVAKKKVKKLNKDQRTIQALNEELDSSLYSLKRAQEDLVKAEGQVKEHEAVELRVEIYTTSLEEEVRWLRATLRLLVVPADREKQLAKIISEDHDSLKMGPWSGQY